MIPDKLARKYIFSIFSNAIWRHLAAFEVQTLFLIELNTVAGRKNAQNCQLSIGHPIFGDSGSISPLCVLYWVHAACYMQYNDIRLAGGVQFNELAIMTRKSDLNLNFELFRNAYCGCSTSRSPRFRDFNASQPL